MKNRKLFYIVVFTGLLGIIASSCIRRKSSQEDQVRNYGKYFIEKVSENELDSLISSYPEIEKADSLVSIQSDTIYVEKMETPGEFEVTLADGVTLKVERDEDGEITVINSKGLFAFPAETYRLAKESGMLSDDPSDATVSERLKDKEYFSWLKKKTSAKNVISLTPGSISYNSKMGYDDYDYYTRQYQAVETVTVTNNTSVDISGSDYSVVFTSKTWACCDYEGWYSRSKSVSGVDLAPGESRTIRLSTEYDMWGQKPKIENPHISLKMSSEELASLSELTGNEYKEYLESKE